jgi:3',5'-cyclic AMP phosphodiesterase CpdA
MRPFHIATTLPARRAPLAATALAAAMALAGCAGSPAAGAATALPEPVRPFPALRLAVVSDIHSYDPALGTDGPAWNEYLRHDRKLLAESREILDTGLAAIAEAKPDLLLVSGDLTKDGELVSHQAVAGRLAALEAAGVKVFVVPGNHDIRNSHATAFGPAGATPVPSVGPEDFARIYADFGYGGALMRDPASLSYLADTGAGLYILGIDSCRWAENRPDRPPVVSGRVDQPRAEFIRSALERAARDGRPVIALMHHGLAEHYARQRQSFGDFVVEDNLAVATLLARGGVRLVFTGHFHANDVTAMSVPSGTPGRDLPIWDLETNALVTWPCSWRLVSLDGRRATVETRHVSSLPSFEARGVSFAAFARDYTAQGLTAIAVETMVKLGVPKAEADTLSPQITEAFMAHYAGDEAPPANPKLHGDRLSLMGALVVAVKGGLVESIWHDLAPADKDLTIDLDGSPATR